jgi:hypothetical protein
VRRNSNKARPLLTTHPGTQAVRCDQGPAWHSSVFKVRSGHSCSAQDAAVLPVPLFLPVPRCPRPSVSLLEGPPWVLRSDHTEHADQDSRPLRRFGRSRAELGEGSLDPQCLRAARPKTWRWPIFDRSARRPPALRVRSSRFVPERRSAWQQPNHRAPTIHDHAGAPY